VYNLYPKEKHDVLDKLNQELQFNLNYYTETYELLKAQAEEKTGIKEGQIQKQVKALNSESKNKLDKLSKDFLNNERNLRSYREDPFMDSYH